MEPEGMSRREVAIGLKAHALPGSGKCPESEFWFTKVMTMIQLVS